MVLYKVLLADDEEEIRMGIRNKINWEENGFVLVGDASNGLEAWEMAEKIRPDVVMTDIKMPFMSGLELGEKLATEMPLAKLVLFSGFDDFEYAKQAIKVNATEYILKPIDSKEITVLLQRLKKQLDKEMKERRDVELLRQGYIQSLPILRQQFLSSLVEGKFSEKRIKELAEQYDIPISGEYWTVSVVRGDAVENGGKGSLSGQVELVPLSLQQIVLENLTKRYPSIAFIYNDDLVIISILKHPEEILDFVNTMSRVCRSIKDVLELSVACGIGTVSEKLTQIRHSFEGAVNALSYRVIMGNKVIYIEDMEPDFSKSLEWDGENQKQLLSAIKFEGEESIRTAVAEIMKQFGNARLPMNQYHIYMTELLSELFKIVRSYQLDIDSVFGSDFTGSFQMQDYESLEDIEHWLVGICLQLHKRIQRERMDSAKLLAEKTKQFVQENFHNSELSVELMCSYLHVSPAYFSTIFKRETGSSFITYLTNVRLEEAMRLLESTEDKTYIISQKVGYMEPNYFSYVFKKHFGVSPSQYRRGKRGEEHGE
ncbi:MAG: response regulator [Epulopiscium sp.]|nr:response regulator [Candidatus Epulonipiscium sp.]